MALTNLEGLFHPKAVAVVGAASAPRSVGNMILRHLLAGGFSGPIMPVSDEEESVLGLAAFADVDSLPLTPDLAVLCAPPETASDWLDSLGRRGVKAVVALCPGYARMRPDAKQRVRDDMLVQARRHGVRMLGPSGLGLIVPAIGLNASLVPTDALPGRIAFVSQSASLFTAALDWARSHQVGFSHVVSLGDRVDLHYHDLLDYLARDPQTRAILLCVESVTHAREFLSAARAAARTKPVLAVKPGRGDEVCSEAFRRAGVLRIREMETLFDAAQTLAKGRRLGVGRLAVLTNGGSLGLMCADTLSEGGCALAELSPPSRNVLDALLGPNWDREGVVDMGCTAKARHYRESLAALLADPGPSAVLVVHAPFSMAPSEEVAQAVADLAARSPRQVLCCWIGRGDAEAARCLLTQAGLPVFDTPEKAARAYLHMARHRRTQELLMELPAGPPEGVRPDPGLARRIAVQALAQGRAELTEPESKAMLAAFGAPVLRSLEAHGEAEALAAAMAIGYPVAIAALSERIPDPVEAGAAIFDLQDSEELAQALATLRDRAGKLGDWSLDRFTVREMGRRLARELTLRVRLDPVFGPYLRLGRGGTEARFSPETAVALPPLTRRLAADLVDRARTGVSPGCRDALCRVVIALAQLATDVPEVAEVDVHPLLADERGVAVQGARIRLAEASGSGADRLAIRPYPSELEAPATLTGGRRVLVRPIRPEDEPAHRAFLLRVSPGDQRLRFFTVLCDLSHAEMARLTQIDFEREMAFIATAPGPDGSPETLGEARVSTSPDNASAEFAVLIRSDMQGQGLGRLLTERMADYCRSRGVREITGRILPENAGMLALARTAGFDLSLDQAQGMYVMRRELEDRTV